MTVNTTDVTSGPYTGNGVGSSFAYDFTAQTKNDVAVYETDLAGVETLLTVDVDYTVNDVGVEGGGTIDRIAGALPTDFTWLIVGDYTANQLTEFSPLGAFFPESHEAAIDKLTFLIQQLFEITDRATLTPRGSTPYVFPTPDAGTVLGWNAAEDALVNILVDPSFAEGANLKSTGITAGFVLVADGADGVSWAASAGFTIDGQDNMYAGTGAGALIGATGNQNIYIGFQAGAATADDFNTIVGFEGYNLGIGHSNSCFGNQAGTGLRDADHNICIGDNSAGFSGANSNADQNVFIGNSTANNINLGNAINNVVVGHRGAINLTDGDNNVINGSSAGDGLSTGSNNVMVGKGAGPFITTGNGNTFLGANVAQNVAVGSSGSILIGGNHPLALGCGPTSPATDVTDRLMIHNEQTDTPLIDGDMSASSESLTINGDFEPARGVIVRERADHSTTPAAGKAELWLRSTDSQLIMTNGDTGVDHVIETTLATKELDIGTWNMDATNTVAVNHGLDWTTIRAVSALIIVDGGTVRYDFASAHNGVETSDHDIEWTSTQILLRRGTGGVFDNTSFDATASTRGTITIHYVNQ